MSVGLIFKFKIIGAMCKILFALAITTFSVDKEEEMISLGFWF